MTTVHGIVIHGRYRYAAFYRLTDLPLPTTPRHLQEWRRLPLRSRRGQDMGQDSAHGTCRQAGAVTRPRLWASANGRRNWRGARSEDPETPPSRLAGPGEATRPRVNRHEWTCWAAECRSRTYCVPSWPCVHSFYIPVPAARPRHHVSGPCHRARGDPPPRARARCIISVSLHGAKIRAELPQPP